MQVVDIEIDKLSNSIYINEIAAKKLVKRYFDKKT
jgi:hypothetical protein